MTPTLPLENTWPPQQWPFPGFKQIWCSAGQETDATLPPWRDAAAMLSKWQPRRSIDMDWDSVPSPAKAAGPTEAVTSQDAAPKHVRRHSGGRASPRGAAAVGATAPAAGLGTRSASQVSHTPCWYRHKPQHSCPKPAKQRQATDKASFIWLYTNCMMGLPWLKRGTARAYLQLTEDTNSPRPSKAQRLGGAAAAAASRAALGLRDAGGSGTARDGSPQRQQRGRPPPSPALTPPASRRP